MNEALNKRLLALASYVPRGKIIADIGTDHAYLPIYLVSTGIAPSAIAADVNEKPLGKARDNVSSNALTNRIDLRLGDGLQVISPGEAQVLLIAGMGGGTIKRILQQSPQVLTDIERIIMQPMGDEHYLRTWLINNGWKLVEETLVEEDERIYTVIVSEKGIEQLDDEIILEVGPRLVEKNHPLLPKLLKKLIGKYHRIVHGLEKSSRPEAKARLKQVKEHILGLEEVGKKCR
ncbi:MAG: SAM-dependent methyltransferase [Firmicutes bacterium]|nr:SAM-dependent methyltransferase [Bacillota bacterium]